MKPLALTLGLIASCMWPSIASAQTVSAETDRLLWCSSAFRFMGAVGETQTEIENAVMASEVLTLKASEILYAEGFSESEARQLLLDYDEKVIADFESGDIPYEGDACIADLDL